MRRKSWDHVKLSQQLKAENISKQKGRKGGRKKGGERKGGRKEGTKTQRKTDANYI